MNLYNENTDLQSYFLQFGRWLFRLQKTVISRFMKFIMHIDVVGIAYRGYPNNTELYNHFNKLLTKVPSAPVGPRFDCVGIQESYDHS